MWGFQFLLSRVATTVKPQDEQILDIVFSASEVGWNDDGLKVSDKWLRIFSTSMKKVVRGGVICTNPAPVFYCVGNSLRLGI